MAGPHRRQQGPGPSEKRLGKAGERPRRRWHAPVAAPGAAAPPSPEDLTVTEDEAAAIRQMVRSLKEPYLQVSVMYFLEERSVEEISRALRRPPKTVHTQLFRAKKMLREQIRERSERQ